MLFVMTDIEKRRLKLLQETRKNYSEKYAPPAIHPRFKTTYHSLYGYEEEEAYHNQNTFWIRCVVAILVFSLFYVMDYRKETIGNIDNQFVVSEVHRNLFSK